MDTHARVLRVYPSIRSLPISRGLGYRVPKNGFATMSDSTVKQPSRRDFLRLFTGSAVDATCRVVAASIPTSDTVTTPAPRARAENPLRAKTLVAAENQRIARCARCYEEFIVKEDEIMCVACQSRDEQNQSLLNTLRLTIAGEK